MVIDVLLTYDCSDNIQIEWRRTNGDIPADTSVEKLDLATRLHFKSLLRSDEDMYYCIGSHTQLSTSFPIQLYVHGQCTRTSKAVISLFRIS